MKKFYFFMLALFASIAMSAENPTLYLLGSANSWSASDSYKFTESSGVYTLSLDEISGTFKIATSDWSTAYGGANDVVAGETYTLSTSGGDCNFKDAVKNATLTFTLSTGELKVEGAAAVAQYDLYLLGSLNDWKASDAYKFSTDDYVVYTLEAENVVNGDYGFQIAASDWAVRYNVESTELAYDTYTVVKGKEYNMKFATEPAGKVKFTLDTQALTLKIEEVVDKWANIESQTLKGINYSYITNAYSDYYTHEVKLGENEFRIVNFLGSGQNLDVAYDDKSVTSITSDSQYWTLTTANWGSYGCFYFGDENVTNFVYPYGDETRSNEMYIYPASSSQALESYNDIVIAIWLYYPEFDENGSAIKDSDGNYANAKSGYEYIYVYFPEESSVSNIAVDENASVEYYNLQGVRVANPSNGIYIQRQGNQAKKVLVK
jgi:hypothetical protein